MEEGLMGKKARYRGMLTCLIMVSLFIAAALCPDSLRAQTALNKVKVGDIPAMTYAPIYLAMEKGYFKEQAIEVDLIRFTSASKMMAPITQGELEVGTGTMGAGLYNAFAEGVTIKIVADKGLMPTKPGMGTSALVVRKDLADTIKSPADLKGRKILLISSGSSHRFFLSLLYQKYNMTEKDVEYIYIPYPEMPMALEKKGADAAYIVEPHGMRAIEAGAKLLARAGDIAPGHQVAVIFYAESFIKNKPEIAKQFMVGYIKGLRHFNKNPKNEEVVDILNKYTKVPKDVIMKVNPADFSENGRVNVESILAQQEWFYTARLIKQKARMEDLVDNSYVDYANKVLGPIK